MARGFRPRLTRWTRDVARAMRGGFHIFLYAFVLAFVLHASAFGALSGVTDFKTTPEQITDAELSVLLHAQVSATDVVAIGETVHGSSGFLRMQARLIRYLVTNHGLRLIVWENPTLR